VLLDWFLVFLREMGREMQTNGREHVVREYKLSAFKSLEGGTGEGESPGARGILT
jgi:hypothetical protein